MYMIYLITTYGTQVVFNKSNLGYLKKDENSSPLASLPGNP